MTFAKTFASPSIAPKPANTVNNAGSKAYSLSAREALAQFAVAGTFNGTYYADSSTILQTVTGLISQVDPKFIAACALYGRQQGHMKDMPSYMVAYLFANGHRDLVKRIFNEVIDNPKMLRNFIQVVRSGKVGSKSLGTVGKKLISNWLKSRNAKNLLDASVGNNPALKDIFRLAHPKPDNAEQQAMFAYLTDKPYNYRDLPQIVKDFETFKKGESKVVPNIKFELLTACNLTKEHWAQITHNAKHQWTRMNVSQLEEKGVFEIPGMVDLVCQRLKDTEELKKSRQLPYQLYSAVEGSRCTIGSIKNAISVALENSLSMVPFPEKARVLVAVDSSGSMGGCYSMGANGKPSMAPIKSALLFAAAYKKTNPNVDVISFDTSVSVPKLNSRDSLETIMQAIPNKGGGTDCSLPFSWALSNKKVYDIIILISDNESWYSMTASRHGLTGATGYLSQYKSKINKNVKTVLIDIVPNTTTQVASDKNVLNVAGLNDAVFNVIEKFYVSGDSSEFVKTIEQYSNLV